MSTPEETPAEFQLRYRGIPPLEASALAQAMTSPLESGMLASRRAASFVSNLGAVAFAAFIAWLAARQNVPLGWAMAVFLLALVPVKVVIWFVTLIWRMRVTITDAAKENVTALAAERDIALTLASRRLSLAWPDGAADWPCAELQVGLAEGDLLLVRAAAILRIPSRAFADVWERRRFLDALLAAGAREHEANDLTGDPLA